MNRFIGLPYPKTGFLNLKNKLPKVGNDKATTSFLYDCNLTYTMSIEGISSFVVPTVLWGARGCCV